MTIYPKVIQFDLRWYCESTIRFTVVTLSSFEKNQLEPREMQNKSNPNKLVLAKAPKPVNQMTEAEIREWAELIAQALNPKTSQ